MNQYQNLSRMITLSEDSWTTASENNLVDLAVRHLEAPFMQANGQNFVNMCSCSYLGWDRHPAILEGAINAIRQSGTLHLTTARCRLFLDLLGEFEEKLSEHFQATAVAYNSCAAASSAALPLLASGVLTKNIKPVMAFDKFAHFSLAHMKPLCADETQIITIDNNDMQTLEMLCRKHAQVAYVSDATYSIKGFSNLKELKSLQAQYGLFLYLDDSHGLTINGELGQGVAMEMLGPPNELTLIVASLAKAFGSSGGALFSGNKQIKKLLVRYGNAWSQYLNSASIGGGISSLDLHKSQELSIAQSSWRDNLALFDSCFNTVNRCELSPIRVINIKTPSAAVKAAKRLMDAGYYTSAVFFPVVPKNSAGLRIMPRADIRKETMQEFCTLAQEICADDLL